VLGDPNRTLPGGGSNAHFGELYLENTLNRDFRFYGEEYLRATVSHEIKTDGWLGTHRLAAMYQERESVFLRNMQANVWQGAPTPFGVPFHANPWHNNNRVYYRHYITNPESTADWRRAQDLDLTGIGLTYSLPAGTTLYDGTVTTGATTLTSDWRQWVAQDTKTEIDALMFAGQSYLLDNKLIVTYGYREDDLSSNAWRQSNGLRDPATNERNIIDYTNPRVTPPFTGETTTLGAVYHINDTISVVYNKGTNVGLSGFAERNILGGPGETFARVPIPEGESEDIGLTFDLFNGRVFVKTAYYETVALQNSAFPSWVDFNPVAGIQALYDIAEDAGFITAAVNEDQRPLSGVASFSEVSEGYEVSAIGNLTENWRISMNYSYTEASRLEEFGEFTGWWEGPTGKSFFQGLNQNDYIDPDTSRGPWQDGLNFGQAIQAVEDAGLAQQALAGLASTGLRKHKANVFTNYTFTEGPLKNFRVGGGAKYALGPIWHHVNPLVGTKVFGGQTLFDAVFGWNKDFEKYNLDLQLNIRNLFNSDNLQISRLDDALSPDGDYDPFRVILNPGRDIKLKATFRF